MSIPDFHDILESANLPRRPVTTIDAGERAGVTAHTISRWVREGKLPGYRLAGHLLRVDLDDVDALFKRV